ncbi:MAG: hypothetical protein JW809_06245 [Pirellulales bacterium]|nr:hypothetical protein [Pirellulales bacterium]
MTTTPRSDVCGAPARPRGGRRLLAPTALVLAFLLTGSLRPGTVEPTAPSAAPDAATRPQTPKAKDAKDKKGIKQQKATDDAAKANEPTEPADFRLREGTRIVDQLGYFRNTGDRVAFFSEDGAGRFIGLENLNLQRVSAVIGQQPEKRLWKVSGAITEYRGENFLLIDRVTLESWGKLPETLQ